MKAVERFVELPFEVVDAEGSAGGGDVGGKRKKDGKGKRTKGGCGSYHEGGGRSIPLAMLVLAFDLFEMSGARWVVGVYFRVVLCVLRVVLGVKLE